MMNTLPGLLGGTDLILWRLDAAKHAKHWDSGEGARLFGGRWNSAGTRAVYCAIDSSTAILETAVHKGFTVLDTVAHVLTWAKITASAPVHIVQPDDVPNPNWLKPGTPGAGQQAFGDALLADHPFVVIPSAVATHSWNVLFNPLKARGLYAVVDREAFALDTRLHPPRARHRPKDP